MYQTLSCLMNSRHIAKQLSSIANGENLDLARLSIVFALVYAHSEYENADVDSVVAALKNKTAAELKQLARELHPILCSINVEKQDLPGGEHWRAERAGPRGNPQCFKALHLSNGIVYAR